MDVLGFLGRLGEDASSEPGFQAQPLYVAVSVLMPIALGLAVGFALKAIERIFGVRLGGGSH